MAQQDLESPMPPGRASKAHDTQLHRAVVICTKDRADDLRRCCEHICHVDPDIPIIVVDGSVQDATEAVCHQLTAGTDCRLSLSYHRARCPGLARQRNQAVDICRALGIDILHFIDDDTEVLPGYFDQIEHRFREPDSPAGVGGVILNHPPLGHSGLKRLFLLTSKRPGAVLSSGRIVPGQLPGMGGSDRVEWLSGCCMSYRITAFGSARFDDRMVGYSLGEDRDFSYRLSRDNLLVVERRALVFHHVSPANRLSAQTVARDRTINIHKWTTQEPALGFRRLPFWWSTFGDFFLRACYGLVCDDPIMLSEAKGILSGVRQIICQLGRS